MNVNKEENNEDCITEFEYKALNKLLSSSVDIKFISALGVFCDEELIAFSISDFIKDDFAYIHFMKANTNYKGCFQFMMKETVSYFHSKEIKFINVGPDLGIPSLKYFKLSYRPVNFLKKYTIESCN